MTRLKDAKYNLGRGLVILGLAVLPFAGCKKDEDVKPSTPAQSSQKHNVDLVYGDNVNTEWQNISMDTIYKYNTDSSVDTIFMIPERPNQYSTNSTNGLKILISKFRERHNVNPNKVFGKGELQLNSDATRNNPEIVRFFADTLKYNVTYYTIAKSR